MTDAEKMEIRKITKAMTRDELEIVVKAIDSENIDIMWKEIWRRYRENEIKIEHIEKVSSFRLE